MAFFLIADDVIHRGGENLVVLFHHFGHDLGAPKGGIGGTMRVMAMTTDKIPAVMNSVTIG